MIAAYEPKDPALRSVYWREEVVEVFLWLRGGGFDDRLDAPLLHEFLGLGVQRAAELLDRLAAQGYLSPTGVGRYRLTAMGEEEGQRLVGGPRSVPLGRRGGCGPECWCSTSPVEAARCGGTLAG